MSNTTATPTSGKTKSIINKLIKRGNNAYEIIEHYNEPNNYELMMFIHKIFNAHQAAK